MRSLAGPPPPETAVPTIAHRLAGGDTIEPVWLNQLGGITIRLGSRYLKCTPAAATSRDVSLSAERERLAWAAPFHPVPEVLDHGTDDEGEWMLTLAIDARSAVTLIDEPRAAARALGEGLRAMHENLPVDACPFNWSAESRGGMAPPPVDVAVVCHGDACLPNTLVTPEGLWAAHVDLGSLGVADRWSDLAVASMSLDWNLGQGWQQEFFAAYGISRDEPRIDYYRGLWDAPG